MHRLIDFSLRNKFLVIVLTAVMVGFGVRAMLRLPIDAVPDVTPNQVLVLTQAPGLGPLEVERFITFPVETASGLPGITDIRSVSRFGSPPSTSTSRRTWTSISCGGWSWNACQTPALPFPRDWARHPWALSPVGWERSISSRCVGRGSR
jgi:hypothetical protein